MTALTAGQAAADALAVLRAAGITRGVRTAEWIGMQPVGTREVMYAEVTVRPADYDAAMVALMRGLPDAYGYSADHKRVIRMWSRTGRVVGEQEANR